MNGNAYPDFFNELRTVSKKYRKGIYAPSCFLGDDMIELSFKYNLSDDELHEALSHLAENGMQLIVIDQNHYLAPGSSVEDLKKKYEQILTEENIDLDLLYYLGTDEVVNKYADTMEKLTSVTFFAIEDVTIGLPVTIRTCSLLGEMLQERHFALHPEDVERSKGWVDEDTQAFIAAHAKAGYIASGCLTAALQDLMIDYGDFPLCHNIVSETVKSMGLTILPTSALSELKPTLDMDELQARLTELLISNNADLEQCYKQGVKCLHEDIVTTFRNHFFFANANVTSFSDASLLAGNLLMKIIQDEHEKNNPDDVVVSNTIDEEMCTALKVYAKHGYVPSWVVAEQYERLLMVHGNTVTAGKVRDDAVASLMLKPLMLDKQEYMLEGSSRDSIRETLIKRTAQWDLEAVYDLGAIPDKHRTEHNHLVSMIFFAVRDVESLEQANELFWDVLRTILSIHHEQLHSDEVPATTLLEVKTIVERFRKGPYVPSWIRDKCIDRIAAYVKHRWYAAHVYTSTLKQWGLYELDVAQEDYLPPQANRDLLDKTIIDMVSKVNIDYDYLVRHQAYTDYDAETRSLIAAIIYFADNGVHTRDEAFDACDSYIHQLSQQYLEAHYPVEAKADSIVFECIDQYQKAHCIPSWLHDHVQSRLQEAGVSSWMIDITLSSFDNAMSDALVIIDRDDYLPAGSTPPEIAWKIREIILRSGLQVAQVQAALASSSFEEDRHTASVTTTIRALVLFADRTVTSINDVDARVRQFLSALA